MNRTNVRCGLRRSEGFTLIELIVVITIIVILAATVVVSVAGRSDQAKAERVKFDFASIMTACAMFKEDHGVWPESLDELMNPPETSSGMRFDYLKKKPYDPWTNEFYIFEMAEDGPLVISYGADQAEGGDGFDADIYSNDQNNQ